MISISVSKIPDQALSEWRLSKIYFSKSPEVCLCGKSNIKECCIIINTRNGNKALLGSSCVKLILNKDCSFVFNLKKSNSTLKLKKLSSTEIRTLLDVGIINEWESDFLGNISKRENISIAQMEIINKIKNRLNTN